MAYIQIVDTLPGGSLYKRCRTKCVQCSNSDECCSGICLPNLSLKNELSRVCKWQNSGCQRTFIWTKTIKINAKDSYGFKGTNKTLLNNTDAISSSTGTIMIISVLALVLFLVVGGVYLGLKVSIRLYIRYIIRIAE